MGVDFEKQPELVSTYPYAFKVGTWFWNSRNLNPLADLGTQEAFDKITLKINGGYNGKAHRDVYWLRARKVLGC